MLLAIPKPAEDNSAIQLRGRKLLDIFVEIVQGSLLLVICTSIQLAMQVYAARKLREHEGKAEAESSKYTFVIFSAIVMFLLLSHTIHLYLWAIALRVMGAVGANEEAIYFALATYTTAGYGDIVLAAEHRLFGAMAAVTGVLAFGLTTAFLVAMFRRSSALLKDD